MPHLILSSELMTGIHEIDVQHQRIVQYINDLYDARQSRNLQSIGQVIEDAVDYTLSHFAFEESMMEAAGYRFAGPHKKVHELFTRKIGEFQARFQGGEDISAELHAMLSRWLFNHIRNDDGSYVPAVKAHLGASGQSPEALRDQLKQELLHELEVRHAQKGWLARLLGN